MSTKSTIAHSQGPDFDFHFYHEVFDDDGVYLELRGPNLEYAAHPDRVQVRIPVEIWEVIRHHAPPDLRFADWTDSQVDAYVEDEVETRIREYRQHTQKAGPQPGLLRVVGSLVYGIADDPRDQQIEAGRAYFRQLRDAQTERKRRIERLMGKQDQDQPAANE